MFINIHITILEIHLYDLVIANTLYQVKVTTDKNPTIGYSIPDEIATTCFQLCELL